MAGSLRRKGAVRLLLFGFIYLQNRKSVAGKYALATTEENQIFFIDLQSKVCEDFSKKVQEKASGAYFTKEHDVSYVVHNDVSKIADKLKWYLLTLMVFIQYQYHWKRKNLEKVIVMI